MADGKWRVGENCSTLQTLNDQLSELAALAPLAEHATLSPRFDRQLFHTRSTLMQAYLAEATHFNQLRRAVERQQLPQVVWIAERLAAQIAALRRETATGPCAVGTTRRQR